MRDDDIDDLVDGILDALDASDPELREKLRESLERGIDLAMDQPGANVEIQLDLDPDAGPDVVVLDGGRVGPPDDGPREPGPDLTVLDGDADDEHVHVEVRGRTVRARTGRIDVHDSTQAVYVGAAPRLYRVRCFQGALMVLADGSPVAELRHGQTTDVEAARIEVHGLGTGAYAPV
ncbi:MAG: hypothetical protein KC656_13665 [Myxococcales bacterium]|nr:hypothetical protein [Myxococcales bacterium]MCB9668289.1 hypothetical protein [Alphaproteobacteria bacterium]